MKAFVFLVGMLNGLLIYQPAIAQNEPAVFFSHGYFEGMILADSLLIQGNFKISIGSKEVKIFAVDPQDSSKNKLYLQRRTMSGIKYTTLDGRAYQVWKLGDRKMVLRNHEGRQYLSLYRTDDYGLPAEYITFKLEN